MFLTLVTLGFLGFECLHEERFHEQYRFLSLQMIDQGIYLPSGLQSRIFLNVLDYHDGLAGSLLLMCFYVLLKYYVALTYRTCENHDRICENHDHICESHCANYLKIMKVI